VIGTTEGMISSRHFFSIEEYTKPVLQSQLSVLYIIPLCTTHFPFSHSKLHVNAVDVDVVDVKVVDVEVVEVDVVDVDVVDVDVVDVEVVDVEVVDVEVVDVEAVDVVFSAIVVIGTTDGTTRTSSHSFVFFEYE